MMQFRARKLKLSDLLLHPNNYRFIDNPDFKRRMKRSFHRPSVQEATLRLLERGHSYQLKALRNSILSNGYVPMERIIVVQYGLDDSRDAREGVISLSPDQMKSFQKIPCAILETEKISVTDAERVIMGIRHIAGPREWGAYQQAQLVYELVEEQGKDFSTIAEHLGLSKVEVGRRYRAMKALRTMEEDDEYSDAAKMDFYRLFHELVSSPTVRERFGWSHNENCFEDQEKAREFFELIAPQDPDKEPKLRTYSDVRKLKIIIGNRESDFK